MSKQISVLLSDEALEVIQWNKKPVQETKQ